MSQTKRPSGGKRAGDKRRAEKAAREARAKAGIDPAADWQASLQRVGEPPPDAASGHEWLGKLALATVYATASDAVLEPAQMRRDLMKQIEQASKVLDPAKLSEQLAELERALEELQDAGNVEARETRAAPSPASLS